MKTLYFYLLLTLLFNCSFVFGQSTKGYIINIEGENIYVDLTSPTVSVGDELGVYTTGGYMTHPVTKQRVKKVDELIGKMKINSTYADYSIARAHDPLTISKLKIGQVVQLAEKAAKITDNDIPVAASPKENLSIQKTAPVNQIINSVSEDRIAVVVAPAEINDVVNSGHFGGYVADVLMEQLLMNDKVRLLDRSVLNAQLDEVNLAGDAIDPATAIQRGKIVGARYIIQVTMQKPDVVNVRTGIPLASIMGAVGTAAGVNIGAQYASNAQVGTLKAAVNISTRVVDLQTGEVLFMTSGTGKAQGKSQLALEYGALGGAQINGGADGFKQTVTGKAIQKAFMVIGRNLNQFFDGTDKKVIGSAGGFGNYGQNLAARGSKLYLGSERLDKDGIQMIFADRQDLFFKYKSAKKTKAWGFGILAGGFVVGTGIGAGVGIGAGDEMGPVTIGACAGFVLGAAGLTLCIISSNNALKDIARDYNNSQRRTADWHLDLTTSGNNLGVTLTF